MSSFGSSEDIVVFVAGENEKFSVMRVPAGLPDAGIVSRIGNVAYLTVTFAQAQTLQQAANIARTDGLSFIPANIIAGMRRREPGVTMRQIRTEFARRVEAYSAPAEASDHIQKDIDDAMEGFEDIRRSIDEMFGGPQRKP